MATVAGHTASVLLHAVGEAIQAFRGVWRRRRKGGDCWGGGGSEVHREADCSHPSATDHADISGPVHGGHRGADVAMPVPHVLGSTVKQIVATADRLVRESFGSLRVLPLLPPTAVWCPGVA